MSYRTSKGINAQRQLMAGVTNHDDVIADAASVVPPRILYRAVVVDVIFDPINQAKELAALYDGSGEGKRLLNQVLLETAPRDSIIARLISDQIDQRNSTPAIFYPLIPHLRLPLKPGEKVWVVFENPDTPRGRDLGYWVSRINERIDVEDPNFTHGSRIHVDASTPDTSDKFIANGTGATSTNKPGFPNGGNTTESRDLDEPDAYETINKNAIGNRVSSREAVPRYNKRPNDWVAEGSNNSLLVLGEDRTGPAGDVSGDKVVGRPSKDKGKASGMWDLVVGRGVGTKKKLPDDGETPVGTAPPVISNTRGDLETNKDPKKANPQEGDPDFENDLSRIYGAMDTDVDGNFGKPLPKLSNGVTPDAINSGAGIIYKTDHHRIISRKDGSIRIIKEGDEDKDRAVILIEKDGSIMIDGPVIVIGSGVEKSNGGGQQVFLGRDAVEPIVLGNTMKQVLTDYSTQIQQAFDNLGTLISGFVTVGNLGLPIPDIVALVAAYPPIMQAVDQATQKFQQDLTTTLSKNGKTK